MTKKEQNMMKLVNYHFSRLSVVTLSAQKQDKICVGVYNHFNKKNKRKLTKRSDITKYMFSLRLKCMATTFGRVAKKAIQQKQGRTIALAIGLGLMEMALMTRKRTED